MGIDFINKTKKTFQKTLDKSLVELGTPDLFTRYPDESPRRYLLTVGEGYQIRKDQHLLICLWEDGKVLALVGLEVVGEFAEPPGELIEALKDRSACGKVEVVYQELDMAEVEIS